jgi:hypothetical protein
MFQLVWLQQAVDELTIIWPKADSGLRQVITDTICAIRRR